MHSQVLSIAVSFLDRQRKFNTTEGWVGVGRCKLLGRWGRWEGLGKLGKRSERGGLTAG